MATFNGYTWSLELVNASDPWVDMFSSKKFVVKEPVPFSFASGASEVTQFLGVGNPTVKYTIQATDDNMQQQLEDLWAQQTISTLDLTAEFGPGFTYNNVALTDVGSKKRRATESVWRIEVEFTQYR